MLNALKKLFGIRSAEKQEQAVEVPYKVEKPVAEVAPAPAPVAETATQAMVESVAPAKKPRAKKPAAAKKPRKPKQPKQS